MTALLKSQIPDDIDTLEKLLVWTLRGFQFLNGAKLAYESPTQQVNISDGQVWTIRDNANNIVYRYIGRVSVPISPNHLQGGQIWDFAQTVEMLALPSAFSQV